MRLKASNGEEVGLDDGDKSVCVVRSVGILPLDGKTMAEYEGTGEFLGRIDRFVEPRRRDGTGECPRVEGEV